MDHPATLEVHRYALAHGTKLAKQREATTFLWSYNKLIGCFNHEIFGPTLTVDTLLTFIKCCTSPVPLDIYQGYRLAMAPVALKPYNFFGGHSEALRCRPVLPVTCNRPELRGTETVTEGDYIVFFKDPSGHNIFKPYMEESPESDYSLLFLPLDSLKHVPSFFKMAESKKEHEISDRLKDVAARTLPHNERFERCVVTGQQSTGCPQDPGSIEARWIYPPSVLSWHIGPKIISKELPSWKCWKPDSGIFDGPGNVISMRKDIYDLFQKNAFGIDIDALPRARIYIFNPSQVESILLPQHPVIEVNDPMARAFLRQHFQRCLFSGIIGGDVSDDLDCSQNQIQHMLQRHLKRSADKPDPVLDSWLETAMGKALAEWLSYDESLDVEEDEGED